MEAGAGSHSLDEGLHHGTHVWVASEFWVSALSMEHDVLDELFLVLCGEASRTCSTGISTGELVGHDYLLRPSVRAGRESTGPLTYEGRAGLRQKDRPHQLLGANSLHVLVEHDGVSVGIQRDQAGGSTCRLIGLKQQSHASGLELALELSNVGEF